MQRACLLYSPSIMNIAVKIAAFAFLVAMMSAQMNALQAADNDLDVGVFDFSAWDGPNLNIHYIEPEAMGPETPVVFVMHGVNRNADTYRDNWIDLAREYGFAVYAPEFDKERFPGSKNYNLGGIKGGKHHTFNAIEPLFAAVKKRTGFAFGGYYMFGHSAGAQFVHRFMFLGNNENCKLAVAANAGWYTLPSTTDEWPYGLKGVREDLYDLDTILGKPLTVILGDQDTDAQSKNLRRTKEALAQGEHRYNRGVYFLQQAYKLSEERKVQSNWGFKVVEGVGHSNRGMAPTAAELILAAHKKSIISQ